MRFYFDFLIFGNSLNHVSVYFAGNVGYKLPVAWLEVDQSRLTLSPYGFEDTRTILVFTL